MNFDRICLTLKERVDFSTHKGGTLNLSYTKGIWSNTPKKVTILTYTKKNTNEERKTYTKTQFLNIEEGQLKLDL